MNQVAQALTSGGWGRERALGLLRMLMAAYAEILVQPSVISQRPQSRRVAETQHFLQSHYNDPKLSAQTIAVALGVSASHLSVLFRRETGQSLHQAVIELRLRRACDLLTRTAYSIKEVASLTGWSSQLYFSSAFHRRHGIPPSALRKQGGKIKRPPL